VTDRSTPATASDDSVIAEIARRYHLNGESKIEIARWSGFSRFKVARLLDEARQRGIVTISVRGADDVDPDLSDELATVLGIERGIVVDAGDDVNDRAAVARAAAALVPAALNEHDYLGLTWSRAVNAMIGEMDELPRCTVVQLAGSLHDSPGSGTVAVAARAAALAGGEAHPIHAPLVVTDPHAAAALRAQPGIRDALAMADRLDVAVVAVGRWRAGSSTVFDAVSSELQTAATDGGAVAEISGRLFTIEGQPVSSPLDDLVVGVSAEQLRVAGTTIALVSGADRAAAVVAACRAGLVDILVTTRSVASDILRERWD